MKKEEMVSVSVLETSMIFIGTLGIIIVVCCLWSVWGGEPLGVYWRQVIIEERIVEVEEEMAALEEIEIYPIDELTERLLRLERDMDIHNKRLKKLENFRHFRRKSRK